MKKLCKLIVAAAVIAVLCAIGCATASAWEYTIVEGFPEVTTDYVGDLLEGGDRELYNIIMNAFKEEKTSVKLTKNTYTAEQFRKVEEYIDATPAGNYFNIGYMYIESTGYLTELIIEYYPCYDGEGKQTYINACQAMLETAGITPENVTELSDPEIVQMIHDAIVVNVTYDVNEPDNPIYQTAYSALVDVSEEVPKKYTVCAGYARALQILLTQCGLEAIYVKGEAGGPHAWLLVKEEGEWYNVDITWDDPDYEDEPELISYRYYNLSDEIISLTHTPYGDVEYPRATKNGESPANLIVDADILSGADSKTITKATTLYIDGNKVYAITNSLSCTYEWIINGKHCNLDQDLEVDGNFDNGTTIQMVLSFDNGYILVSGVYTVKLFDHRIDMTGKFYYDLGLGIDIENGVASVEFFRMDEGFEPIWMAAYDANGRFLNIVTIESGTKSVKFDDRTAELRFFAADSDFSPLGTKFIYEMSE